MAAIWKDHEKRLIAANLRGYKGRTEVNEGIQKTIASEPQHFFYLNNGLTAYCERLEIENVDRADANRKRVTVYGFSIVNGAQTLGSIAKHMKGKEGSAPEGSAFLKIISLQKCAENRAFAIRITQSTNFQNQISPRDFVALEEEQAAIAATLALSGVQYHFKDADDTPASDASNFTLDEATTALASLEQQSSCDLLSRIIAKRSDLWFAAVKLAWESSPDAYVNTWHSPVLLIQGDDDRNVAFEQTVDLAQRLRDHHVPFEQLVLPDEIHGFMMWKSWIRAFTATADFFDRTLKQSQQIGEGVHSTF